MCINSRRRYNNKTIVTQEDILMVQDYKTVRVILLKLFGIVR
jgi:hypothetical protein